MNFGYPSTYITVKRLKFQLKALDICFNGCLDAKLEIRLIWISHKTRKEHQMLSSLNNS